MDEAAQERARKGGEVLEQLWRGGSGAVREQSTAEDAEKPGKGEERSTACQEGRERLGGVEKWGMGERGEQLGGKPDACPKLGSERAFLASTGHSSHPAAPKAEPQSPELCWARGQGDGAGPRGLSSARAGGSAPRRGSLATELWTPGNAPSPIPSSQGSADPSGMSLTVVASHDILSQQHCPPSLCNKDSLPTPQLLAVGTIPYSTIPGAVLLHH